MMARKKSVQLTQRQKRRIRIQQIIFVVIALIVVGSMLASLFL
jgi:predicted nucleic acid-binding Zn ribbon protein